MTIPTPRPEDEANPYSAPEAGLGRAARGEIGGPAEAIRREHINHEASLRAIGFLYYLSTPLFLVMGVAAIASSTQPLIVEEAGGKVLLIGFGVLYLVLSVVCGFIGYGLRALVPWGRWLAVGLIGFGFVFSIGNVAYTAITAPELAGATLVGALFGMIVPAYILYLLLSSKGTMVFSPEYKDVIARTPHVKYRTSCIVWGALIVLGVVILLAIIGGIASTVNR